MNCTLFRSTAPVAAISGPTSSANTNCARAQVWTLRERLLKLGAHMVISVRRMVLHLPASLRSHPR
jgi:hypothetical protein